MKANKTKYNQNKYTINNSELITRRVYTYSLFREGYTYDQISLKLKLSRKTIERDMKWCKNNLPIMDIKEFTDTKQPTDNELFKRNISIYMQYCEGLRYDELADKFELSQRTIYQIIKWCRENIPNDFCDKILDDVIFDTVRRRAIVWSKFKEFSESDKSANQLAAASKHILELDSKILEWRGIIKNKMKNGFESEYSDINDLIKALDEHLKNRTDEELKEIIKKCNE
jgi:DNA-binding CsgD family transcriptional regulator